MVLHSPVAAHRGGCICTGLLVCSTPDSLQVVRTASTDLMFIWLRFSSWKHLTVLASSCGYIAFAWYSIFIIQFLNAAFSLETALFTGVFLFLPVSASSPSATLFTVFPFHLSICWYHKLLLKTSKSRVCYQASYTAIKHFSSAPSNCLLIQKNKMWTCLEQKKAQSLFERTHEESNTSLDPKVNGDNCR